MRGIYKIENKINNKVYIGESLDIERRWKEHKESLRQNKHMNYKLQKDWNKYKEDNFEFSIITIADDTISNYLDKYILLLFENKYIHKYNSIKNGYNIENTLLNIFTNDKIIYSRKDKAILKRLITSLKTKELIDKNKIIHSNKLSKKAEYKNSNKVDESIILKVKSGKYPPLRRFIKNTLKIQDHTKVYKILISGGILKYAYYNNRRVYFPADKYLKYFEVSFEQRKNSKKVLVCITTQGIKFLKRYLDDQIY